MIINLNYKLHSVVLDRSITPLWSEKIKRWSQLDDASLVLAHVAHDNLDFLTWDFNQLVLVSNQGSGKTDYQFVTDAKISPSNFVHTLPNVRSVVFSMATGWEGEMFCLSHGKNTLLNFLKEIPEVHANTRTLIVSLNKVVDRFECDFYKTGPGLTTTTPVELSHNDDSHFRKTLSLRDKK
jgi:hypothetical protein